MNFSFGVCKVSILVSKIYEMMKFISFSRFHARFGFKIHETSYDVTSENILSKRL